MDPDLAPLPNAPGFLARLTLQDLARLQRNIARHGQKIRTRSGHDCTVLRVTGSQPLLLTAVPLQGGTDLLVLEADGHDPDITIRLDLKGTPLGGTLHWNWFIQVPTLLAALDALEGVMSLSLEPALEV